MFKTDVLVIGSGIAGLSFALKIAELMPGKQIDVLCKRDARNCNTSLAQGGIAVVTDLLNDSYQKHIEDTLRSGAGLSDPLVVETVVQDAPERLRELLDWGVEFDRNPDGKTDLHREGGHCVSRILHRQDQTGLEIENKLLSKLRCYTNVNLHTAYQAHDFILKSGEDLAVYCAGVWVYEEASCRIMPWFAGVCMLASGGCGMLYASTTNPAVSTGDGLAMALRAGLPLRDMAYMQFHPTALYTGENSGSMFLVTEALRGYGARIINGFEQRFLFGSDSRGELATRDIVSSAIRREMQKTGSECVYLDLRHLDPADLRLHFPAVCQELDRLGLDFSSTPIPVIPAAHYQCGGIAVNLHAETALKGLYASGECASTGLHGKNRLASNSLIEALVFSHRAALHAASCYRQTDSSEFTEEAVRAFKPADAETEAVLAALKRELRSCMDCFQPDAVWPEERFYALEYSVLTILDAVRSGGMCSASLLELDNMVRVASAIVRDLRIKQGKRQAVTAFAAELKT